MALHWLASSPNTGGDRFTPGSCRATGSPLEVAGRQGRFATLVRWPAGTQRAPPGAKEFSQDVRKLFPNARVALPLPGECRMPRACAPATVTQLWPPASFG